MPAKKKLSVSEPVEEQSLEQMAIERFEEEIGKENPADAVAVLAPPPAVEKSARADDLEEVEEYEAPAPDPEVPKKRYITKETPIDKFTIKRTRIELTPAVCDKCGFDVAARNGLGDYHLMSPEMQAQVKAAIAEHKQIVHTIATDLIVDEDDVPTAWLGTHKKFV